MTKKIEIYDTTVDLNVPLEYMYLKVMCFFAMSAFFFPNLAKSANPVLNPQSVQTPEKINTNVQYQISNGEFEITPVSERDGSERIFVSKIYIVEVLGVSDIEHPVEKDFTNSTVEVMLEEAIRVNEGFLTIEQLQNLANRASRYLVKEHGYLLATVYLPVQKIRNGVIKFALLPGRLGEVSVENSELYNPGTIAKAFSPYVGRAVRKDEVEEVLLRLQDMPGFKAVGRFSRGNTLGETSLTLRADENKYDSMLFIDNFGSEFTGRFRAGARITRNNLFNKKDALSALVYLVETPDGINHESSFGKFIDCCDGSISYEMGLDNLNSYRLGFNVSKTNYDVGNVDELTLSSFAFAGETLNLTAYVNYLWLRGKQRNATFSVSISQANAKTKRQSQLLSEDDLTYLQTEFAFDFFDSAIQQDFLSEGRNLGNVQLVAGRLSSGGVSNSRLAADSDFIKVTYSLSRAQALPPLFGFNNGLNIRLNGQYTTNKLVGIQQMGIGGPSSVRAYPTGAFLADKGVYVAVDWVFSDIFEQGKFGYSFDPYMFTDFAKAKVVEGETFAVKKVHLGSYGIGFNWQYGKWTFGMVLAKALGSGYQIDLPISEGGRDVIGRKNVQIYSSIKYQF